jgi:hypothetical protein
MSGQPVVNFCDLPQDTRAAAMQAACDQYHVTSFWDLDPDQRRDAYNQATSDWYGSTS